MDAPHQQLLAEETQDFGDWRELAGGFDNILAKASALPERRSTAIRPSADWNLADALCEDISAQSYEALLREALDDCGDYRQLVVEVDNIFHRGLDLEFPPKLSSTLCPSLFSKAGISRLLDWLIAPLRNRAAGGAFATLLLVAVLTPDIYQLSRQTPEREHSLAPLLDFPPSTSFEPVIPDWPVSRPIRPPIMHPETSNGADARTAAEASDEVLRRRSTNLSGDGEMSRPNAEQPRASVAISPPPQDLVGPTLKQHTAEAGSTAGDWAEMTTPRAPLTSFQAFQSGTRALRAGDTKAGLSALEYAAANGQPMAAWRLGRMYADGDGVKQSDLAPSNISAALPTPMRTRCRARRRRALSPTPSLGSATII